MMPTCFSRRDIPKLVHLAMGRGAIKNLCVADSELEYQPKGKKAKVEEEADISD
jgi:hypothetical protein